MNAASNVVSLPSRSDELMPEGVYQVVLERHRIETRFGRGSLELWFRVLDYGDFFGRLVPRYYKVEREGKRTFRASRHSAFAREFATVFRRNAPAGIQAVEFYRDLQLEAKVRAVTKDHRQRELVTPLRYNVVEALIGRVRA